MSYHHGKDGAIKVAVVQGTPALVAEVYEWEWNPTAPMAEATAMRGQAQQFKPGIPGATGSLSCRYDPDDTEGQAILEAGQTFEFELYPLPETSGNPVIKGTAHISSSPLTGSVQDIIDQSFEFTVDGVWTTESIV